MRTLLEDFLSSERLLRDAEVCELLGWSAETLKSHRARRIAPKSIKVRAVHLTPYSDLADFITAAGKAEADPGESAVAATLLGGAA
jgi:hypothetical protein